MAEPSNETKGHESRPSCRCRHASLLLRIVRNVIWRREEREREREKRQRRGQLDRRCILNNFIGTTGCYREVDTVREEEKEDKKNPCDNKIYIIFIRACAFSILSNKKLALERGANSWIFFHAGHRSKDKPCNIEKKRFVEHLSRDVCIHPTTKRSSLQLYHSPYISER